MKHLVLALALIPAVAQAEPILFAKTQSGKIELYNESGHCVRGARRAVFTYDADKSTVEGCWKVSDNGVVRIAYLDADAAMGPSNLFQRLPES